MSDLDAAAQGQAAHAVRTGVAVDDIAYIGHNIRFLQVSAEIDSGEVEFRLVGAADEIAHRGDRAVGDDPDAATVDPDRPEEAGRTVEGSADFSFVRQAEIRHVRELAELDFIEHVVAAQQQDDHLLAGHDGDELDGASERNLEQGGDVLAGGLPRRIHLAQRFQWRGAR